MFSKFFVSASLVGVVTIGAFAMTGCRQSGACRDGSCSAPTQSFAAPTQSYAAPSQSYSAPPQSYSAPQQGYLAPGGSGSRSVPSGGSGSR